MTLAAGTILGPYEILAPLGAGGMGEVYRARDTRLGREVAIKVLPESFSKDPDRLRRFEQEARAASQLNHPNIVTVHDFGTHGGAPYVVQELLEASAQTLQRAKIKGFIRIPWLMDNQSPRYFAKSGAALMRGGHRLGQHTVASSGARHENGTVLSFPPQGVQVHLGSQGTGWYL